MDINKLNTIEKKIKIKGIAYIVSSAVFFAVSTAFIRLAGDIPSGQKLFFRNVIVSIGAFILIAKDKSLVANANDNKKDLFLRAIFGTIGILGNMYAVDHIPLSDASMLNKMSPFFAIVFSYFILKEKINLFQALSLLGALGGCILVVKPTFSNENLAASLIGFFAGASAGLGYTFVRKLGSKGVNGIFIVFFLSVFSVIITSPFLIFDYKPMSLRQVGFLLIAGICATLGQFGITGAYATCPPREISVFDYSQVLFAAIVGFITFNQLPDLWSFLGYITIISMAILMYLYNVKGLFNSKIN